MTTETTEDLDLLPIESEEEDIGQGEIQFTPTGIRHKDMAIAGMINDATNACKALIKAKVWEKVCASPNPAGAAEIELLRTLQIPDEKIKLVLIKLKIMLAGLNMTIPQAFHKCILETQLKRVNMGKVDIQVAKDKAYAAKIAQEQSAKEPVTQTAAVTTEPQLNGSILTNTDGATYTFGTRGRRPLWVKTWLETHPEPT
jgi:hypothetical protein